MDGLERRTGGLEIDWEGFGEIKLKRKSVLKGNTIVSLLMSYISLEKYLNYQNWNYRLVPHT